MAFEELKDRFGAKGTIIGVVLVVIAVGLFLVNNFVLKGKQIIYRSVTPPGTVIFTVNNPNTRHVLELYTYRKRRINYELVGPKGTRLFSSSDFTSKKTRRRKFRPALPGNYTVKVKAGLLSGRSRSVSVRVYERDRRVVMF